jgi:hypothetical protein
LRGDLSHPAHRSLLPLSLLLLFCGLLFCYGTVQNPGYLDATDAEARLAVVTALMDRGETAVRLRFRPDEVGPVKYTITSAVAAWPAVVLGRWLSVVPDGILAEIRDVRWFVLGHTVFAAAAATAVAWGLMLLGMVRSRALLLGMAVGLTTILLHYARSAQSEGFCALLVMLVAIGAWWHAGRPGLGRAALTGLFLGFLISTKVELVVMVPGVAAYLGWSVWRKAGAGPMPIRALFRSALGFGLGLAPGFLAVLAWNWMRYGHPLSTGYGTIRLEGNSDGAFPTPLWYGLSLQLMGPGKSIFYYAPLLLPALGGWCRGLGARGRGLGWCVAGMVLPSLVLYSMWFSPLGGTSIGPRFVVIFVPVVCLGLAGIWRGRRQLSPLAKLGLAGAVLVGLVVQASFCFSSYIWQYHETMDFRTWESRNYGIHRMSMDPMHSPIVVALADWVMGYSDLRWVTGRPLSDGMFVERGLAVGLTWGVVFLGLAYGLAAWRRVRLRWLAGIAVILILPLALVWSVVSRDGRKAPVEISIRDRGSDSLIHSTRGWSVQFAHLRRYTGMMMGTDQGSRTLRLRTVLRVDRPGTYEFRWRTGMPGFVAVGSQILCRREDWGKDTSSHRGVASLEKGLVRLDLYLDEVAWFRSGVCRLEWRRDTEPFRLLETGDLERFRRP